MPGKIVIVSDTRNTLDEKQSPSEENSLLKRLKKQPYLALFPVGVIVLIIIVLVSPKSMQEEISDRKTSQSKTTAQGVLAPSPTGTTLTGQPKNFLSWLFPAEDDKKQSLPGQSHPTPIEVAPGTNATAQQISKKTTGTTSQRMKSGNNSGQTANTTTGSSGTIQTQSSSTTQTGAGSSETNEFELIFQSDGETYVYEPPETPPVEIVWSRYVNQQDNYSLDYPANWQIVRTQYNNHEAVFVYAPGSNPQDPAVQYISFGWAAYYYPPDANYTVPVLFQGVPGTIYTNGALGDSYIAAAFHYLGGYFALVNNLSDETFVYIFDHMLESLEFE